MSSREGMARARDLVYRRIPELCVERAQLLTESYKETENEPPVVRRAKALSKILGEMTIRIDEEELIVGKVTSKTVGGPLIPEIHYGWYLQELDAMSARADTSAGRWTEDEQMKVKEIVDYWQGKSVYDKWWSMISQDYQKLLQVTWAPGVANPVAGFHLAHCCPGLERVLTGGIIGIRKRVEEELTKLNSSEIRDSDKCRFLESVDAALEAVTSFSKRYADLAGSLAGREADIHRKAELERIAAICGRVPANPARDFYEAMQSLWFVYIALVIEGFGPGVGFGRIDQYLFPFYKKDVERNLITREKAKELISLFYIKLNELITPFPINLFRQNTGQIPLSGITLGGVTPEGEDGVNELSYIFLDAEKDVRLQEDLIVRVHRSTPDAFLMKACEIAKLLKGKAKFVSDETIIRQQLRDGKPIEYARDYAVTGCFIRTVPGRSNDNGGDFLNLPMALELALNNGISRITGDQIGPRTGDPRTFQSYEEVVDAYKKQVAALIRDNVLAKNLSRQLMAEYVPTPLQSALFDGCIEKATDVTKNGTAPYTTLAMWVCGIPTVGDSLAAIKKVVFDDKRITMSGLIEALDNNFEGKEELLRLLERAPKFGNDDDYVDGIVNEVLAHFHSELAEHKGFADIKYTLAAGAVGVYMVFGKAVGALPDGRKAGEPLSDGGISPYHGRDINGPTSTMRSVAKLDLSKTTGGAVLNMKFNPDSLKDGSKMRNFVNLLKTFCQTGGDLVQFNIVGSDMLRDAQKHPEQFKDLLVRVATYSAYFVDLETDMQDQIIARTEFRDV